MARIKKKGTSGNAKNYITRSQAVRKLQISLPDFRRLCIFKGIYPREPRSKKKVSKSSTPSTTFYYARDIQYLLHEPLLGKFRDQKALSKKIAKALGRNEYGDAARLEKTSKPKLRLDHIVKERYPTFVDALRDLDDALCVLFLFANLPASENVPAKVISQCQRLTLEFEHYVIRTHCLRKSFLSIKGIYYQATIEGQDILWLVPYRFVQRAGAEIDFRIMATFVDFYTALLGFVNFRLYTGIGLIYPPRLDPLSQEHGGELGAFQLQSFVPKKDDFKSAASDIIASSDVQRVADDIGLESHTQPRAESGGTLAGLDKFTAIDENADVLSQPLATSDLGLASALFQNLTVFISRECPRHSLEFILKAFGCRRVGWDSLMGEPGSYCSEDDYRITHQIIDRPDVAADAADVTSTSSSIRRIPGRIYIQPQWIWDSVNAGQLKRYDLYTPGAILPPHLSPWMKPKNNEYDPTAALNDTMEASSDTGSELEQGMPTGTGSVPSDRSFQLNIEGVDPVNDVADMDIELAMSDDEQDDATPSLGSEDGNGLISDDDVVDESEYDSTTADIRYQLELEAETSGAISGSDKAVTKSQRSASKLAHAQRLAAEDVERRKMMMPRRKRKMYEKMVFSNARKDEKIKHLQQKRRKIEKTQNADARIV